MIDDEPHAVRWARRTLKRSGNENVYTKYWHITIDSNQTLCGYSIANGLAEGTFLPETNDIERADCPRCLRKFPTRSSID